MGLASIKIAGADRTVTNNDATNWTPTKQFAAVSARLYKLSVSNLSGSLVYLWFFDVAAGTASSAAPVMVRPVPEGMADTWDFGPDGGLFGNGIYVCASTTAPTDITTTPTAVANDAVILKAEVRNL